MKTSTMFRRLVIVLLAVMAISSLTGCYAVVGSNEVGVKVSLGRAIGNLAPGSGVWYIPLYHNIVEYSTQDMVYETSEHPDQSEADFTDFPVTTTTNDGQTLPRVSYTVRFNVQPDNPTAIYNNVGGYDQIVEKIVKANSRVRVRNILRRYDANELYSGKVARAEEEIWSQLNEDFAPYNVEVTFFGLRDISFEQQYLDAVEAKQIEKENIERARNVLEQRRIEAEQQVVKAEADAEERRIRAEAEANANRALTESLSPEVIQWRFMEVWNGELPMYTGAGNLFLPFETSPTNVNP